MSAPRDLPPGAGPLDRAHLRLGDLAIRLAGLRRPAVSIGARLAAFDAGGRVFLVRHSYIPGWHLPGGAVEHGETPREAALREAREEGGIAVSAPPVLLNLYLHPTFGRRDYVAVFVARDVARDPTRATAGPEIREAGFFDPDAPPDATTPATLARIAEALGRTPVADRW